MTVSPAATPTTPSSAPTRRTTRSRSRAVSCSLDVAPPPAEVAVRAALGPGGSGSGSGPAPAASGRGGGCFGGGAAAAAVLAGAGASTKCSVSVSVSADWLRVSSAPSHRRGFCHFADAFSPSLLMHPLKVEGGCSRMAVSSTAICAGQPAPLCQLLPAGPPVHLAIEDEDAELVRPSASVPGSARVHHRHGHSIGHAADPAAPSSDGPATQRT